MQKWFLILMLLSASFLLQAVQREYVVVEVVTGTWCQYCPGAALGVEDMLDNGLRVAVVEYHGGDTFENTASGTRINYYGVSSYPTALFDGLNPVAGGDHNNTMYAYYVPKYNNRINVNSPYTITLTGEQNGNFINVAATVSQVEASTAANLKLHAVLTESNIEFAWQGQDWLHFVERGMYPSASGTAINLTQGNSQTVNLSINPNAAWVFNNLELVVFLQNNSTKEILQGTKIKLAGLINAFPISAPSLDFGDVVVNHSSQTLLYVNNYWNQTMTGTITTDNPLIQINSPGRDPLSIPASGQEIYQITCFPEAIGTFTGNIIITTNIPAYPTITIPVTANSFYDNQPTATDVHCTGNPVVYVTLTGHYTFADIDDDAEGTSLYQWYRVTSGTYVNAISGETGLTYIIQPEDIGAQVLFQVSPVDEHGIMAQSVMGIPTEVIIARPAPQNVAGEISNNQDVILTWQPPTYYGRGLLGYKIYRNGSVLTTLMNPATLTYTDANLPNGTYQYYLTAVYNSPLGYSQSSNGVVMEVTQSTDNHDPLTPGLVTGLKTAFPNPFSTSTTIRYSLQEKSDVDISIYDVRGRKVRSLSRDSKNAGEYEVVWDGRNDSNLPVANGVYFCKFTAGKHVETMRIAVIN